MIIHNKLFKLHAWRDNNITINCTQGEFSGFEGSNITGKTIQFQFYDENGVIDLSEIDEIYYDAINERGEQVACDKLIKTHPTQGIATLGLSQTLTCRSGVVKGEIRLTTTTIKEDKTIISANTKFYGVCFKVNQSNNDGDLITNPQFSELEKLITYVKAATQIDEDEIDFAKYLIDDTQSLASKTYSSQKILNLINRVTTRVILTVDTDGNGILSTQLIPVVDSGNGDDLFG